jgi:hypothetical protein
MLQLFLLAVDRVNCNIARANVDLESISREFRNFTNDARLK